MNCETSRFIRAVHVEIHYTYMYCTTDLSDTKLHSNSEFQSEVKTGEEEELKNLRIILNCQGVRDGDR